MLKQKLFNICFVFIAQSYEGGDYWDDEWDDDSEGGGAPAGHNIASSEMSVAKSRSAGDVQSMG